MVVLDKDGDNIFLNIFLEMCRTHVMLFGIL